MCGILTFKMYKQPRGFKKLSKEPVLLIPALPCLSKRSSKCHQWFIPTNYHQKECLHCLRENKNVQIIPFKVKTPREHILLDVKITWIADQNRDIIEEILILNERKYQEGDFAQQY